MINGPRRYTILLNLFLLTNLQIHTKFFLAANDHEETKNFKESMKNTKWREAMQNEISILEENETWTIKDLSAGKRVIDCKWIYKVKYKPTGEVERYKVHLVAKGFTQQEGVDFHDTFAPVAKLVTFRTLLAIVVKKVWAIHQLDVNNDFLH